MLTVHALRGLIITAGVLVLVGCAAVLERSPVPSELVGQAEIPGVPKARAWGDEWPRWWPDRLDALTDADAREHLSAVYDVPHSYLAISGGSANGAFGAGLLAGWTESGTRPEFTVVTGISTGALIAPFAFLGPAYDHVLREFYTTLSTKDIATKKRPSIISLFRKEAVSDTAPLRALIEKTLDAEVIAAIAEEHRKGRGLYIGTVNLDASRSVIWNIGEIANSDYPRRNALIHDILQASSAIPIAFPPVMIPVSVGTETYDEMHVDGGTGMQVFVYPAATDFRQIAERLKVHGQPKVYVIRNARLDPGAYAGVQRSMLPIARRSIGSLTRTQGIGDLYQIHSLCMRDGTEFNLAHIPADFKQEASEPFDPAYMKALFELSFEMARDGYDWQDAPPGYKLPD